MKRFLLHSLLVLGLLSAPNTGIAEAADDSPAASSGKKKKKKKAANKKATGKKSKAKGVSKKEREASIKKLKIDGITSDSYEETAFYAAKTGNDVLLMHLLNAGVDPNLQNSMGRSLLSWAAGEKHVNCVKLLLAKPGIEVNTRFHPLWWAVFSATRRYGEKKNDCIELLLKHPGIDLNCREAFGIEDFVPLSAAIVQPRIFKQLLDAGADVNAHNGHVLEIMSDDAEEANELYFKETQQLLFNAPGFDPNIADENGNTILHRTCRDVDCSEESIAVIPWLLSIPGIDINKRNKLGETPAHILFSNTSASTSSLEHMLSAPGIDLTLKDGQGKSILQRAIEGGDPDSIKALQDKGVKE